MPKKIHEYEKIARFDFHVIFLKIPNTYGKSHSAKCNANYFIHNRTKKITIKDKKQMLLSV